MAVIGGRTARERDPVLRGGLGMYRYSRHGLTLMVVAVLTCTGAADVRAQYLDCRSAATAPDSLFLKNAAPPYLDENLVAEVRCVIHVLREDNGLGGLGASDVDSMLNVAQYHLSALGVVLVVLGRSDLANSHYYADPDSLAPQIFAEDPSQDAIDIYLGPPTGAATGLTQGIPSSALLLTGSLGSYSALTHLLGHCLGLYDTSESAFGLEEADGSNSANTGDLVADTSADPGLEGWVESNCELSAAFADSFPGYSPDTTNIMSNGRMTCWSTFTCMQRLRVMSVMQSYATLAQAVTLETAPYVNRTSATEMADDQYFPETSTNATSFDFNNDSMKDLLVSGYYSTTAGENLGYAGACLQYTPEGVPVFVDATLDAFASSSVRLPSGTLGLIAGDYDNDGNIDFYAPNSEIGGNGTQHGHSQRLYRNTGTGGFQDVTSAVNLRASNAGWDATIGGAWGDYDSDGFLDLLTVQCLASNTSLDSWSAQSLLLFHNIEAPGPARAFESVNLAEVGLDSNNLRVRSVFWVDFDQDHDMDLITIQYTQSTEHTSRYYLNTGGHFEDVTTTLLSMSEANNFETGHFCAAPGDFDNDGDVDFAYNGTGDRGWVRNDLDAETGVSALTVGWNDHHVSTWSPGWPIAPTDLDVFDYDLDGLLDIAVPNFLTNSPSRLFRNQAANHHFVEISPALPGRQSHGLGAADFKLHGFTDLFLANRVVSPRSSSLIFYKATDAIDGTVANHWVGVRLQAPDSSCNSRGIGSTVIVTAGSHRQAQVVDGGSGRAGQHDLDLSFGLGTYSGSVDVEIIWPCGQTQFARVAADTYHTISMTKPVVDDSSVLMYFNYVLGEDTLDWVFEWTTAMPGDNDLDWVEFPGGIPGHPGVDRLDSSMPDVGIAVTAEVLGGTTVYTHRVTWFDRPCPDALTAYYKVHSKVLDADDSSVRKTLHLYGCPQS